MEDLTIAMVMIAGCLMLVAKISFQALSVLKEKYKAQGSIDALNLIEEDKYIDLMPQSEQKAMARLAYKIKRDKLLSRSKILTSNAIADSK